MSREVDLRPTPEQLGWLEGQLDNWMEGATASVEWQKRVVLRDRGEVTLCYVENSQYKDGQLVEDVEYDPCRAGFFVDFGHPDDVSDEIGRQNGQSVTVSLYANGSVAALAESTPSYDGSSTHTEAPITKHGIDGIVGHGIARLASYSETTNWDEPTAQQEAMIRQYAEYVGFNILHGGNFTELFTAEQARAAAASIAAVCKRYGVREVTEPPQTLMAADDAAIHICRDPFNTGWIGEDIAQYVGYYQDHEIDEALYFGRDGSVQYSTNDIADDIANTTRPTSKRIRTSLSTYFGVASRGGNRPVETVDGRIFRAATSHDVERFSAILHQAEMPEEF